MIFNMHDPMVCRLNVIIQAVFTAHSTSDGMSWDDCVGLRADSTGHFRCGDPVVDDMGVGTVGELSTGYENRKLWEIQSPIASSVIRASAWLTGVQYTLENPTST